MVSLPIGRFATVGGQEWVRQYPSDDAFVVFCHHILLDFVISSVRHLPPLGFPQPSAISHSWETSPLSGGEDFVPSRQQKWPLKGP